jgi:hypothetical protein
MEASRNILELLQFVLGIIIILIFLLANFDL